MYYSKVYLSESVCVCVCMHDVHMHVNYGIFSMC